MIQKLRRRFIGTAMLAFAAVLLVIVLSINAVSYFKAVDEADATVNMLLENDGAFPASDPQYSGDEELKNMRPQPPREEDGQWRMSAEFPFETRYFTVTLDLEGNALASDVSHIAAITRDEAVALAQEMLDNDRDWGTDGCYHFSCKDRGDAIVYVFLDSSRSFYMVYETFMISLAVMLIFLVVAFPVIWAFSGRAVQPLVDNYEKQRRFITDASHELKTPLTIIDANTEVLELENGENEWTASIRNQVAKLSDMTHRLVDLARMEENSNPYHSEEFDFSAMAKEVIEPFAAVAQAQHLTLHYAVDADIRYKGDAKMLHELISILLDNAMKYAKPDTKVEFSVRKQGKNVVIESRNEASGIQKGALDCFFDRFYRADASHNGAKPGSGIGLSLAQAIVYAHKGKIQAVCPEDERVVITAVL